MAVSRQLVRIDRVPNVRPEWEIRALRRVRSERRVPSYLILGRVYFNVADLDSFIESTCKTEARS